MAAQQESVLSYLNNNKDNDIYRLIASTTEGGRTGWNRERGVAAATAKQFVSAKLVVSPTTGKYGPRPKKLSTLVTNDWAIDKDEDNAIWAIGYLDVAAFSEFFQLNPDGAPANFPVFIYGTWQAIIKALLAMKFLPARDSKGNVHSDGKYYDFIVNFGITKDYVTKGRRKIDVMIMTDKVGTYTLPTIQYLLAPKEGAEKEKRDKRVWNAVDLDRIIFISNNLPLTTVIDVNGKFAGNYGGKLTKSIENHFIDKLTAFEKEKDYVSRALTTVFNISDYTHDGGYSVTTKTRPKTQTSVAVEAQVVTHTGAQPVPYGFKHGDRAYGPGFVVTDNLEALNNLFEEMKAQLLTQVFFVTSDGNPVTKETVIQMMIAPLKAAEELSRTRGKGSKGLDEDWTF